ncbi:MAG: hypothetical protein ACXVCP_06950 [Bdellovibrio sp.]
MRNFSQPTLCFIIFSFIGILSAPLFALSEPKNKKECKETFLYKKNVNNLPNSDKKNIKETTCGLKIRLDSGKWKVYNNEGEENWGLTYGLISWDAPNRFAQVACWTGGGEDSDTFYLDLKNGEEIHLHGGVEFWSPDHKFLVAGGLTETDDSPEDNRTRIWSCENRTKSTTCDEIWDDGYLHELARYGQSYAILEEGQWSPKSDELSFSVFGVKNSVEALIKCKLTEGTLKCNPVESWADEKGQCFHFGEDVKYLESMEFLAFFDYQEFQKQAFTWKLPTGNDKDQVLNQIQESTDKITAQLRSIKKNDFMPELEPLKEYFVKTLSFLQVFNNAEIKFLNTLKFTSFSEKEILEYTKLCGIKGDKDPNWMEKMDKSMIPAWSTWSTAWPQYSAFAVKPKTGLGFYSCVSNAYQAKNKFPQKPWQQALKLLAIKKTSMADSSTNRTTCFK